MLQHIASICIEGMSYVLCYDSYGADVCSPAIASAHALFIPHLYDGGMKASSERHTYMLCHIPPDGIIYSMAKREEKHRTIYPYVQRYTRHIPEHRYHALMPNAIMMLLVPSVERVPDTLPSESAVRRICCAAPSVMPALRVVRVIVTFVADIASGYVISSQRINRRCRVAERAMASCFAIYSTVSPHGAHVRHE